ncbi:hypothetical protein B0A50_04734 [Salinomyces thailandicus]|uniref:DUF4484 domain-containing protein n=1 Tax=Salinomyces thailandicus TaxID=706561 RepID=A0A4U0TXB7_9PEZI|nr:hypothetical protein B0A50_04734 [Salinomyces thailandica]
MEHSEPPPVIALFQVVFDQKVGYTTAWKRSLPGVDLDGVEYKCLPSGLHSVESDLVYFTHGPHYAGISAFAQEEADTQHRNAKFCAVGALVQLSYGTLGRSWLHVAELSRLAKQLAGNKEDAGILESYWERHEEQGEVQSPKSQHDLPGGPKRKRGSESHHGFMLDAGGVQDHPALYIVGISDIPLLSSRDGQAGWIATTTDDILGEKDQLWDVLVELGKGEHGSQRRRPRIRTSNGKMIKASQRDLRRYRQLRGELRRMQFIRQQHQDSVDEDRLNDQDDDRHALRRSSTMLKDPPTEDEMRNGEDEAVEPVSWTAMAYDSFMWWASAGEEDTFGKEQDDADRQLLTDLPDIQSAMQEAAFSSHSAVEEDQLHGAKEVATVLTAYFHRITTLVIQTLADIITDADDGTEEGIEQDVVTISAEEVNRMGLDVWSERDMEFVQEMTRLYFGREAEIEGAQDIGDLSSKVALVTGGNAGIGKATVEALAVHKPACIYICARNLPTAQTLVDKLQKSCPDTKLQILELDLASLESVKKCASDFIAKSDRLDLLFLNAGVGTMVPKVTNEGYEVCFGVNHMGHALLTQLLLPKMLQTKEHDHSADLRIVATSSVGAYRFAPKAGIDVSQMTNAKAFGDGLMARYGHSKLANVLFTRKLAELYPSITTTSVHPGTVKSEIFERARQEGSTMMYWLTYPVVALTGVTVEEGAKTQLWAGTAPGVKTGGYYEPVGKPVEKPVFNDSKQVEALWKYTEHELSRHGAPGWPNL